MTSQVDSPDGPYITSFQLIDEEWAEITYQEPVPPDPKVVTIGVVRIQRNLVADRINGIIGDLGDILDEVERFKGTKVAPDRIRKAD